MSNEYFIEGCVLKGFSQTLSLEIRNKSISARMSFSLRGEIFKAQKIFYWKYFIFNKFLLKKNKILTFSQTTATFLLS